MIDLRGLVDWLEESVVRHSLGRPGEYARRGTDAGINPYGVADAANILYTIGRFPRESRQREAWVGVLQSMQDPATGLFHESTHHDYHCTAHCIAAMELFDARPLHPLRALHFLLAPGGLETFLDRLDWDSPWNASHQGAGIFAALTIAEESPLEWQDRYFAWLDEQADPETGFFRKGHVPRGWPAGLAGVFPHLAGTFHYLFNYEAARRAIPCPQRLIDSCLSIAQQNCWPELGKSLGFAEIDWVYCITRPLRQCGHRHGECMAALRSFAQSYGRWLTGQDLATLPGGDDLHVLFGVICCLAELQTALPGEIRTERPLKLPLDRRPFI